MGNVLADLVLPRRCIGCRARGDGWCARCLVEVGPPQRVARAARMARVGVYALAAHQGVARDAVLAVKERNRRDLAAEIGAQFAVGLRRLGLDERPWLVPAPSGRAAARVRGGQHMALIARHTAAALAVEGNAPAVARALSLRRGVRDSVGLAPVARMHNLVDHLRVDPDGLPPPGACVVLLDDVVTTGATASSCVRALRGVGIRVQAVLALTEAGR
jgi:predicted amidophosphoribosyltransferase